MHNTVLIDRERTILQDIVLADRTFCPFSLFLFDLD